MITALDLAAADEGRYVYRSSAARIACFQKIKKVLRFGYNITTARSKLQALKTKNFQEISNPLHLFPQAGRKPLIFKALRAFAYRATRSKTGLSGPKSGPSYAYKTLKAALCSRVFPGFSKIYCAAWRWRSALLAPPCLKGHTRCGHAIWPPCLKGAGSAIYGDDWGIRFYALRHRDDIPPPQFANWGTPL